MLCALLQLLRGLKEGMGVGEFSAAQQVRSPPLLCALPMCLQPLGPAGSPGPAALPRCSVGQFSNPVLCLLPKGSACISRCGS